MITGWRRLCAWGGLALAMLLPTCTGEASPDSGRHGGWHVQRGPAGAREPNELFGVSAASSGDVWAVGVTLPSGGPARTLVERWQGRAWRTVPSPDRPSGGSFLNTVVALSAPTPGQLGCPAPGWAGTDAGAALGRTAVGHHCQPECRALETTSSCRWRRHQRKTRGRSVTATPGGSIDRWWSTGMAIAGLSCGCRGSAARATG